jgi:hypothetical protein
MEAKNIKVPLKKQGISLKSIQCRYLPLQELMSKTINNVNVCPALTPQAGAVVISAQ